MSARPQPAAAAWQPVPQRIAVFRALQLGDMLCAVPALRALRAAFPHARITLVGLPNAAGFVERFNAYLDDLLVFPGCEGMPEQTPDEAALPAFFQEARARRFDLAIQLHGSGVQTNPLVAKLRARQTAGFVPVADRAVETPQPLFMPWPESLPEVLRYTALMQHLGIPVHDTALEFPLHAADREAAGALLATRALDPARTVLIHPGARLASRRWPVGRFAQVASAFAERGWQIAITGSADERFITGELVSLLDGQAVDLTGATSLGSLAALVARCPLVICNDTGISHVAAAVGTPSVVVASGSDVSRWAPLNRDLHTVVWHDMPCRPCAHPECPLPGHPCAQGVDALDVIRIASRKLEAVHA